MLIEDAYLINILGVDMYAWGLHVALGAALALAVLAVLWKKQKQPAGGAAVTGLCMLVCGFVLSRLLFVFFDGSMRSSVTLEGAVYVQGGGYSMFGALLGAYLGAWVAARCMKISARAMLDRVTVALMLFVVVARLGERYTDIGISRPLVNAPEGFGPFVTVGEYDSYISTYLLESILAAVIFIVCLWDLYKKRREGFTALLGWLLFGASQTVLESLRFDQHMKFSFVGVQQVLAMVLLIAVTVLLGVLAVKKGRGKKWLTGACIYLVCLMGAVVGLEFLIDRSGLSRLMLYSVYVLLMTVPCVMGIRLRYLAERE